MKISLLKKLKSTILRVLNPDFGCCQRCKMPWRFCEIKSVYTIDNKSTFATCRECWDSSSLEDLKIYYSKVYDMQHKSGTEHGYGLDYSKEHLLKQLEIEFNK